MNRNYLPQSVIHAFLFFALCFALISQAASAQVDPYFQWLEEMSDPQQVRWLTVLKTDAQTAGRTDEQGQEQKTEQNEEQTEEQRFFALHATERLGQAKGAVILIPAQGNYASRSVLLINLHKNLPDHGWHSLAITTPNYPSASSGQRSENVSAINQKETTPSDAGTANSTAAGDTQTKAVDPVLQRLQSSIDYLHTQNLYNIILIGTGSGALHAARFTQESSANSNTSIQALIMVDAQNRTDHIDSNLTALLPQIFVPVLDIVRGVDDELLREAKARRKAVKRYSPTPYQQLTLPTPVASTDAEQDRTVRRIRGWLSQHLDGKEISIDN